jgi:uncharacterized protein YbjT (DUF2867 family)
MSSIILLPIKPHGVKEMSDTKFLVTGATGATGGAAAAGLRDQGFDASALKLDVTNEADRRATYAAIEQDRGALCLSQPEALLS